MPLRRPCPDQLTSASSGRREGAADAGRSVRGHPPGAYNRTRTRSLSGGRGGLTSVQSAPAQQGQLVGSRPQTKPAASSRRQRKHDRPRGDSGRLENTWLRDAVAPLTFAWPRWRDITCQQIGHLESVFAGRLGLARAGWAQTRVWSGHVFARSFNHFLEPRVEFGPTSSKHVSKRDAFSIRADDGQAARSFSEQPVSYYAVERCEQGTLH